MSRCITHMDLDSFFVSCERLKNSALNNKPVIIAGGSNRGVVSSCSYEARKFGVRSAMPSKYAKKLCPDGIFLKGDMELYSKYSHEVKEVIAEKAPLLEQASIDEFYMDITGMDRFYGNFQFTKELIDRVEHEVGLPMSFGMSVNKTVSKMATNSSKPHGFLEVPEQLVLPFLDPQSIRKIPMLGGQSFKLLSRIGIKVIKTLREMPREAMDELMGKNGVSLWKKANGIDTSKVIPHQDRKSISTEQTFMTDTTDMIQLNAILVRMVEKLAFQLRKENKLCATISVRIRYSNFDTEMVQKKIAFTSSDEVLIECAKALFKKVYTRRMLIRLIGVKVTNLVQGSHQIDLFNDTTSMISLYQAMDRMKIRYGSNAIMRASGIKHKNLPLIHR